MAIAKKQNLIIRYLTPFGLKQLADLLIVAASVLIVVGLNTNQTVLVVALVVYSLASLLAIVKCLTVLLSKINRASPVYKNAFVNFVVMTVILAISVLTLIWAMNNYYNV